MIQKLDSTRCQFPALDARSRPVTKLLIPAMIMNAQLLYSNGVICLVTLECSWFAVDDDDDDDDDDEEEEEEEEVWVANHKAALHGAHFF